MRKTLYRLTPGDRAILEAAKRENNPNRVSNYYLRHADSGTWWRPVPQADIDILEVPESKAAARRWKEGYETLHEIWTELGHPDFFGPDPSSPDKWLYYSEKQYEAMAERLERVYRVIWETGPDAIIHDPHGALMLDWQLDSWNNNSPVQVENGGYGSGKTLSKVITYLVRGIMLPGYRALALAPFSTQSLEVHKQALLMLEGTLYEERFLLSAPTRPLPKLNIGHDGVGRNSIECYSILDGSGKILTLTADEAMVDQAEQLINVDEDVRNISSRFRGLYRGRPRRGQITLMANSGDNPMLWDLFDEGQEPGSTHVWSYMPATWENTYLTVADLIRYESTVARDKTSRDRFLKGERPIGGGDHFPESSLAACKAQWLDERMQRELNRETPGWIREEARRVGVHRWETPPDPDGIYLVAADPGWSNPPARNSSGIGVWLIGSKKTGITFPAIPATMTAFSWVYGEGSPNPWMAQYTAYVNTYQAIALNGYDATGFQSGYDRLTDFGDLQGTPVNLSTTKKHIYLTLLKKIMADGMLQIPTIPHLFSQLSKYKLPDEKMRQDLVMMLLVTAALLEPFWYIEESKTVDEEYDTQYRLYRPDLGDRYGVHER